MGKRNEAYNVGTIHKAKYSDIEIIEDLGKTKRVKFLDDSCDERIKEIVDMSLEKYED